MPPVRELSVGPAVEAGLSLGFSYNWLEIQLSQVCQVSYQLPLTHGLPKFWWHRILFSSACPYGPSASQKDLFTVIMVRFQKGPKGDTGIQSTIVSLKYFFFIIVICLFIDCLPLLNVGSRITCLFCSPVRPQHAEPSMTQAGVQQMTEPICWSRKLAPHSQRVDSRPRSLDFPSYALPATVWVGCG